MAKLSVLIIAKNEEKNIGDCIESVKNFADEVLVIDDFSEDKTVEIAKNLGARVIQHAHNQNWGQQKTFAIENAASDWIFILDADERVTPKLAEEIKKILASDDKNFAYQCARLCYIFGKPIKHGGWFPGYVMRLLPKNGTRAEGVVHEKICHNCTEKNFPESAYLIHYPYKTWSHQLDKMNTYTNLMAKRMYESGKRTNIFSMFTHPIWAGFRMYFLEGGFLDGLNGAILAAFHCFYTFVKYVKLYFYDKENLEDADKNV